MKESLLVRIFIGLGLVSHVYPNIKMYRVPPLNCGDANLIVVVHQFNSFAAGALVPLFLWFRVMVLKNTWVEHIYSWLMLKNTWWRINYKARSSGTASHFTLGGRGLTGLSPNYNHNNIGGASKKKKNNQPLPITTTVKPYRKNLSLGRPKKKFKVFSLLYGKYRLVDNRNFSGSLFYWVNT